MNLLLVLFFAQMPNVNLDEIQVYNDVISYKTESGYAFVSRAEKTLALQRHDGKIFRYAKQGEGPRDLHIPTVLGVVNDQLLIISNSNNIISFDNQLRPTINLFPPLPQEITQSKTFYYCFAEDQQSFWITRGWLFDPIVIKVTYDKTWEITEKAFPKAYPGIRMPNDSKVEDVRTHGDYYFHSFPRAIDQYEVMVHQKNAFGKNEGIMILSASFNDEPLETLFRSVHRAGVRQVLKIPGGFSVGCTVRKQGAGPFEFTLMVDLFNDQGEFQRRTYMPYDEKPIPVINAADEVYMLKVIDGTDMLTPWNPLGIHSSP